MAPLALALIVLATSSPDTSGDSLSGSKRPVTAVRTADSIVARLSRRDVSVAGDRFGIYLDPYHDRRSGYYFLVSAAGTMLDGTLQNDSWDDSSWDGVWEGKAHIDSLGWTVEMRIPYSQLRFEKS